MKKIFYPLIFVLIISNFVNAETQSSSWGDNSDVFTKGFENQKAVSDTKMKNTVNMLKERALSAKQRKIRKQVQPISPQADEEHLKDFADSQSPDNELSQTLTVMIPVRAYSDSGVYIQPGYYKLSCRKVSSNEYVLDLSQGTTRILSVKASQTNEDLNQDSVTFCNAEIIDNGRIRLMYGSLELNLVGYIYFEEL